MEAVLRNEPNEVSGGSGDTIPISSQACDGMEIRRAPGITQALCATKKPQNPRRNPRILSRTFNSQEEIKRSNYVA